MSFRSNLLHSPPSDPILPSFRPNPPRLISFGPNPSQLISFQSNPSQLISFEPNPSQLIPLRPNPSQPVSFLSDPTQLISFRSNPSPPFSTHPSPAQSFPTQLFPVQPFKTHFFPIQPSPLTSYTISLGIAPVQRWTQGESNDPPSGICLVVQHKGPVWESQKITEFLETWNLRIPKLCGIFEPNLEMTPRMKKSRWRED